MTPVDEAFCLVERIKPLLAGNAPEIQSVVLAELLSIWVRGHHVLGDKEKTAELRAGLLARHFDLVRDLVMVDSKFEGSAEA